MRKIIAIHSFRGGTGKSNITANLATVLASFGYKIGVVDTDLQSPGIHIPFGLKQESIEFTLNDYLWESCEIDEAAYDVTPTSLKERQEGTGSVYLVPGSFNAKDITRIVEEGYDLSRLSGGLNALGNQLNLDFVLVDTHPGLNNETLLCVALADLLLMILRPDSQDFQGTAVTIEVSRELEIPKILMIVNRVLASLNPQQVRSLVENTYQAPVAGILPNCDEMMLLASRDLFCLRHPDHPFTQEIQAIARQISV
jgi:MinD-like ATPase involved in chromosome partitioning or flagellar assembly